VTFARYSLNELGTQRPYGTVSPSLLLGKKEEEEKKEKKKKSREGKRFSERSYAKVHFLRSQQTSTYYITY